MLKSIRRVVGAVDLVPHYYFRLKIIPICLSIYNICEKILFF